MTDFVTLEGATDLAARIRAYWAARGFDVNTTVNSYRRDYGKQEMFHVVRSDMVNGLPHAAKGCKPGFATGGLVRGPARPGEDTEMARLSQPQAWHPPGKAGNVTRRYTAMLDEINGTKTVDMTEGE